MKISSQSFAAGARIPEEFGFGKADAKHHIALSLNRNPHFAWSEVPPGVKSFALICHDSDVPTEGDDVNQEGREVPASLAREDFFHWVLIEIPSSTREIAAASFSKAVTPKGKIGPSAPLGARHGVNDYTYWFAADPDMAGDYFGYDGPCPPWNDALLHHYHFTLYALDVETLPLLGKFGGNDVRRVIAAHTLDTAVYTGTYSLNPSLLGS
jgi:Raf kinase inhibitor-like YbhB/YbcL family protein